MQPVDTYAANNRELERSLATLLAHFHDPPWKQYLNPGPYRANVGRELGSAKNNPEEFCKRTVCKLSDIADSLLKGENLEDIEYVKRILSSRRNTRMLRSILEALRSNDEEKQILEEFRDFLECFDDNLGCYNSIYSECLRSVNHILGRRSRERKAHEVHGLLYFYIITFFTLHVVCHRCGNTSILKNLFNQQEEGSESEAQGNAENTLTSIIKSAWSLVKSADGYSSTLDRYTLLQLLKKRYRVHRCPARRLVLVNMYNPWLQATPPTRNEGDGQRQGTYSRNDVAVAEILLHMLITTVLTAIYVSKLIAKEGCPVEEGGSNEEGYQLFTRVIRAIGEVYSSIYESVWSILSDSPMPAESRSPNHSVFDHNFAVASTALLFHGNNREPRGYLVRVALRGVKQWITESRRVRDLWASSWIASWLTWKTIEPLVEKYGSAIMMRPPPRLHTFYASKLWSQVCGTNASLDDVRNRGRGELTLCTLFRRLLGIYWSWPLDPVVPTEAILILPKESYDEDSLAREFEEAYQRAWVMVLEQALTGTRDMRDGAGEGPAPLMLIHDALCSQGCQDTAQDFGGGCHAPLFAMLGEARCLLGRLEPPLPLEVRVEEVGSLIPGLKKAIREEMQGDLLTELNSNQLDKLFSDLARKADYHIAFTRLFRDSYAPISLRGRRDSSTYLKLARLYHRGLGGNTRVYRQCTVCGRPASIVDGNEINQLLERVRGEQGQDHGRSCSGRLEAWLRWLSLELGRDRLCPYCYVKRVFRSLVKARGEDYVGLKMPQSIYWKLHVLTVDALTTRTFLDRRRLVEHAVELARELDSLEERDRIVYILKGMVSPYSFLSLRELKQLSSAHNVSYETLKLASTLVLEASHNEAFPSEVGRVLEARGLDTGENNSARGVLSLLRRVALEDLHRRHIALLYVDADDMGKVLSGVLGHDAGSHVLHTLNLQEDCECIERTTAEIYKHVLRTLSKAKIEGLVEPERYFPSNLSTLATPTYHSTIYRSLAVQAVLDRSLVEALNGLPIYIAGDEMLAVLPPFSSVLGEECEKEPPRLPTALEAVELARDTFWGVKPPRHPLEPGLMECSKRLRRILRATGSPVPGFNKLPSLFHRVPAPVVYGRTAALVLVDSKYPLWMSLRTLFEQVEEAKKSERVLSSKDAGVEGGEKDVLLIHGFNRGLSLLPLTRPSRPPVSAANLTHAPRLVENLIAATHNDIIGSRMHPPRGSYSRALHRSVLGEENLLRRSLEAGGPELVLKVIDYVGERRGEAGGRAVKLSSLLQQIPDIHVLETKYSGETEKRPLIIEVFKAAHVMLGSL